MRLVIVLVVAVCTRSSDLRQLRLRGGSDLNYPTPPNPFGAPPTQGASTIPTKPVVPPPPSEPRHPAAAATADTGATTPPSPDEGGLLGGFEPARHETAELPTPTPSTDDTPLNQPSSNIGIAPPTHRRRNWFRPAACLAILSSACVVTRPQEASLVAALDEHRQEWAQLIDPLLADKPIEMLNLGLASAAVHGDLVWLGLLGRWLPLLPSSADAMPLWTACVGAPQILLLTLTCAYLLRKLVPGLAERHLSTCFRSLVRQGRVYTSVSAAATPTGLVHWLHAVVMLVLAATELEAVVGGRRQLVGWWFACGAASALSVVVTQLLFGRRAQSRSVVSGAVMGLLLLRTAADPTQPIAIGSLALPPLRLVLMHTVRFAPSALALKAVPARRLRALCTAPASHCAYTLMAHPRLIVCRGRAPTMAPTAPRPRFEFAAAPWSDGD